MSMRHGAMMLNEAYQAVCCAAAGAWFKDAGEGALTSGCSGCWGSKSELPASLLAAVAVQSEEGVASGSDGEGHYVW